MFKLFYSLKLHILLRFAEKNFFRDDHNVLKKIIFVLTILLKKILYRLVIYQYTVIEII